MRNVRLFGGIILITLLIMVPLAIAEDGDQTVVDNPVAIETPLDESQPESNIVDEPEEMPKEKNWFFTITLDAEINSYDPEIIAEEIKNGEIKGDSLLDKLNDLYNPEIKFAPAVSLDNSWRSIHEDTGLALGDILVNDDFSEVGIWIADEEVYSLNHERIQTPSHYEYYNRDLHRANNDVAAANDDETSAVEQIDNELISVQEETPLESDIQIDSLDTPTAETVEEFTDPAVEPAIEPTLEENVPAEPITDEVAAEENVDPVVETNVDPAIEQPMELVETNLDPATEQPIGNPLDTVPVVEPITELPVVPATAPSSPYFSLVFDDKAFRAYCPLNVSEQIENGDLEGATLIEQLQALYSNGIKFTAGDSVDSEWTRIDTDTRYILGDILVSKDFSTIGIWINKDEVFCLNDNDIKAPAEFFYYNQAFQSKTIQEVW